MDLKNLTIKKAQDALKNKEVTSVDLTNYFLEEIKKKNSDINAYLEVFDDAIEQAKIADDMIARGEIKSLTGIPLAIKDNLLFKGHKAGTPFVQSYSCFYCTK